MTLSTAEGVEEEGTVEEGTTGKAALIGKVVQHAAPLVTIKSAIGVSRILDMPSGEQLPRIC